MLKFFFNGYGWWFFKRRSNQVYSINPLEKISGSGPAAILFPVNDDTPRRSKSIETTGYFYLPNEHELLFKETGSTRFIKQLFPNPEGEAHTTFPKITQNVMIGFKSVLAENCYFLIDTDKEFVLLPASNNKAHENNVSEKPEYSNPLELSIKPRNSIKKIRGSNLIILHAALDEIEKKEGKTPTKDELSKYVLSNDFKHNDILEKRYMDKPLNKRELITKSDGTIITDASIKRCYSRTIFSC